MIPRRRPRAGLSPKNNDDQEINESWYRSYGLYSGVGIQLVASVTGGGYLGDWLDHRWNTAPWLFFAGLFLGMTSGFYFLFRVVQWNQQTQQNSRKDLQNRPKR